MSEQQTIAAPSPAEVEDVFRGENVSLSEYSSYRNGGEIPARFKPAEQAESAPADAPEETAESEDEESESEPESEPEEETQQPEHPKPSAAERRIKQLLAKTKELEQRLNSVAKPDAQPEPSPARQQYTRPKPTAEDLKPDGTPRFSSYEEFVEELADWKAEQRWEQKRREQAQQDALKTLRTKLDDARNRYEDADEVIFPTVEAVQKAQIPGVVKRVIEDSEMLPDLCYVIGSDPAELRNFISLAESHPRAAIAKVFEYERAIREELAAPAKPQGETVAETKTRAPKPPAPVTGGSSRAFDVNDESLSPEEWMRKRNADLQKRRNA